MVGHRGCLGMEYWLCVRSDWSNWWGFVGKNVRSWEGGTSIIALDYINKSRGGNENIERWSSLYVYGDHAHVYKYHWSALHSSLARGRADVLTVVKSEYFRARLLCMYSAAPVKSFENPIPVKMRFLFPHALFHFPSQSLGIDLIQSYLFWLRPSCHELTSMVDQVDYNMSAHLYKEESWLPWVKNKITIYIRLEEFLLGAGEVVFHKKSN